MPTDETTSNAAHATKISRADTNGRCDLSVRLLQSRRHRRAPQESAKFHPLAAAAVERSSEACAPVGARALRDPASSRCFGEQKRAEGDKAGFDVVRGMPKQAAGADGRRYAVVKIESRDKSVSPEVSWEDEPVQIEQRASMLAKMTIALTSRRDHAVAQPGRIASR